MPQVKIRVSVALDTNINTVYRPVIEAAEKAANEVEKRFSRRSAMGPYRTAAEQASRSTRKIGDATVWAAGVSVKSLSSVKDKFGDLSRAAEKGLNLATLARTAERELKRVETQAAKTALGIGGGGRGAGRDMAYRMGYWTQRNFAPVTPMLSYAKRAALDIARGAGVNFDLSSMVGTRVEQEKLATEISNQAFMPGASGAAGVRQDPHALMEDARKVANETAMSQTAALQGISAFVGKTGDLDTARAVFGDLAKLSRATGTALEDMVSASGDVANALGDTDHKSEKVAAVMRAIAGQGKLGAVEIKDLAAQMAKLASAAPAFEGDVSENLKVMGALAQEARQRGGASTATIAATSVAGVLNILRTPARVEQFKKAGIDVFNKEGQVRDIREIVVESLTKTKGDAIAFKKLFANTAGSRAVEGFATVFRQAGGGEKGVAAVKDEFDRLLKSAIGVGEVNESFARSMQTTEAKAQQFQNKLQDVVGAMADRVIPKLLELAPVVEKAANAFANIVTWAADNPAKAIMAAFGVALAKSAAEQGLRVGVESLVRSFGSRREGGAVGPLTLAGQGAFGNAMAGLTIASAAVTIAEVGMLAIDQVMSEKAKRDTGNVVTPLSTEGTLDELSRGKGPLSDADRAKAEAARKALQSQIAENEKSPSWFEGAMGGLALTGLFGGEAKRRENRNMDAQAQHLAEMKTQLGRLNALLGGTLNVNVTNQAAPTTGVNDAARTQNHP